MVECALRFSGVTKKFRRRVALRDLRCELPCGRVAALVGPNGAGKTTLMLAATGLLGVDGGRVEVLGVPVGRRRMPEGLSFLAQHKPLYSDFSVGEMLRAAEVLNGRAGWDAGYAAGLVAAAGIGTDRRIRELSPGQRARVALAIALGRRPRLLLLDEPLAELDPLARREVMGTLLAEAGETGMTVLMSSHVITDLEDACDHLILLREGSVLVNGPIEDLLSGHQVITGPAGAAPPDPGVTVHERIHGRQRTALIRGDRPSAGYRSDRPSLDDLVLGYLQAPPGWAGAPVTAAEGGAV